MDNLKKWCSEHLHLISPVVNILFSYMCVGVCVYNLFLNHLKVVASIMTLHL